VTEPDPLSAREQTILAAVVALLVEHGFADLTTDAVAARARVSKQTIYRRWPSKAELVVAAVRSLTGNGELAVDTGSLRGDLTALLQATKTALIDNDHLSVPALLSATRRTDADLDAALSAISRERRQPFVDAMRRAVERGELAPDVNVEALVDSTIGALFLRHLFRRVPTDDAAIEAIVDVVVGAATPLAAG
jgi:AcrR family transcriptional regulator